MRRNIRRNIAIVVRGTGRGRRIGRGKEREIEVEGRENVAGTTMSPEAAGKTTIATTTETEIATAIEDHTAGRSNGQSKTKIPTTSAEERSRRCEQQNPKRLSSSRSSCRSR